MPLAVFATIDSPPAAMSYLPGARRIDTIPSFVVMHGCPPQRAAETRGSDGSSRHCIIDTNTPPTGFCCLSMTRTMNAIPFGIVIDTPLVVCPATALTRAYPVAKPGFDAWMSNSPCCANVRIVNSPLLFVIATRPPPFTIPLNPRATSAPATGDFDSSITLPGGRIFLLVVQGGVRAIHSVSFMVGMWRWMERAARVFTAVLSSPEMLSTVVVLAVLSVLSLAALTRFVSSSQRRSIGCS